MRHIQVIDGADNSVYAIFGLSESDYKMIFPLPGQDIEFIEDTIRRLGEAKAADITKRLWKTPILKDEVLGIHGTLFLDLSWKLAFYPS